MVLLAGDTVWPRRVREWLRANASFRRYVLKELERNGPMLSRQFEDRARAPWPSNVDALPHAEADASFDQDVRWQ